MANELQSVMLFISGLVISTIIVYITTKLFGQKEGIGRALVTAIVGAIVYSVAYLLLGNGLFAAALGGLIWLIALRALYDLGWLKALIVAAIVWIAATIVGLLLPTVPGPL